MRRWSLLAPVLAVALFFLSPSLSPLRAQQPETLDDLVKRLQAATAATPVDYPELLRGFVRHGADAVPRLTVLAQHRNPVVRDYAFGILAALGPIARSALPVIREGMNDPAPGVQGAAAYAWTRVSTGDEAALISILRKVPPRSKAVLIGFLCERDDISAPGWQAVTGLLTDQSPAVRQQAARVFWERRVPPAFLPAGQLERALADPDPLVRVYTAGALIRSAPKDCAKPLRLLLTELRKVFPPADAVQDNMTTAGRRLFQTVIAVIRDSNADPATAVPVLAAGLEDAPLLLRQILLEEIIAVGSRDAASLAALLESRHNDVRRAAARALAQQPNSRTDNGATAALTAALQDPDIDVRAQAAQALIRQGRHTDKALSVLGQAFDDKADSSLQQQAVSLLTSGSVPADKAVPLLLRALRTAGNDSSVAHAVVRALEKVPELSPAAKDALAALAAREGLDGSSVAAYAARVLLDHTDADVSGLVAMMEQGPMPLRLAAVNRLRQHRELPPEARTALRRVAEAGDRDMADAAAMAWIGTERPPLGDLQELAQAAPARIRVHAVHAIGRLGTRGNAAVPGLSRCLSDPDPDLRRAAALALPRLGPEAAEALPALKAAAAKAAGERNVRAAILKAIMALETAGPATRSAAVNDSDAGVRAAAAAQLSPDKAPGSEALATVLEAMRDENAQVRRAAVRQLAQHAKTDKAAVAPLVDALADPDFLVRQVVGQTLTALGPNSREAVPVLMALTKHENMEMRRVATFVLRSMRRGSEAGMTVLVGYLDDPQYKRMAAGILGSMLHDYGGPDLRPALPGLIRALDDSEVRWAAARAIARMGAGGAPAVPALRTALQDENPGIRSAVLQALGRIGVPARQARDAVAAARTDPDANVRKAAEEALARIDATPAAEIRQAAAGESAASRDVLLKALANPNSFSRAARALRRMGPAAKPAVPLLVKGLNEPRTFHAAAEALAALGATAARDGVPALALAVNKPAQFAKSADEDDDAEDKKERLDAVRCFAAQQLGKFGPRAAAAVPSLMRLLDDGETFAAGATALGRIGSPAADQAVPRLLQALDEPESYPPAAMALAALGAAGREAIPILTRRVGRGNLATRRTAIDALGRFGPEAKSALPELQEAKASADDRLGLSIDKAIRSITAAQSPVAAPR